MSEQKKTYEQLEQELKDLQTKVNTFEAAETRRWGRRWWITKKAGTFFIGIGLKESIRRFLTELSEKKTLTKDTIAGLSAHVIWRLTRIGLIGLIIAVVPALILVVQTLLLRNQNELLTKQNEKIDRQILLDEASRRSSLNFLMANVLDKMDEELKAAEKAGKPRRLSSELIGRIASLSQSFQPYRFMDGDTMIGRPLSPERGNLLLAIVNSNLDTVTLDSIYLVTTFQYSWLRNVVLDGAYLQRVNLSNSNLEGSDFFESNLREALLSNSNIKNARFVRADIRDAYIHDANLYETSFYWARLNNSNLSRCIMYKTNLGGAYLAGANFNGSNFYETNLEGSDITEAEILSESQNKGLLITLECKRNQR